MHDCHPQSHSRLNFLAATGAAATMLLPGTRAVAQAPAQRKLIDVHHHHYPPELIAVMNAWQAKHSLPAVAPGFWTPEKSLADMDASGTTTAILSHRIAARACGSTPTRPRFRRSPARAMSTR